MHDETILDIPDQIEKVIKKGIHEKASDLHFELTEKNFRVRCRKDGLLYEIASFSKKHAQALITRLKVMGSLDISEHRLPQDGRFNFLANQDNLEPIAIDCRISTCPTWQGEKVVIRLLNTEQRPLAIENLGMDQIQQNHFKKAIFKPQGLILVTGPTGSGKTLTLYTALTTIHHIEKNILTIEDPIEIQLSGINQTAIAPKIGFTFAKALKAFLRQDPDIIMVGEIRDEETASIAVRAAQTGHLVFSTLHTNSALESFNRLINLGVSSYNIASTLSLIISQRLIRKLCEQCKQRSHHSPRPLSKFSVLSEVGGGTERNTSAYIEICEDLSTVPTNKFTNTVECRKRSFEESYQAIGCSACHQGYLGRTGIFEVLPISNKLNSLLSEKPTCIIQEYISKIGITSLQESAANKIREGITSQEEVRRVI